MPKKQAPSDVSYHKDLLGLKKRPALLESLFLDPKNPRFKTPASIAESRYEEQPVQERALAELKSIGIDDLLASIRSYGFVPSDPLVVRPLGEKKHVVVEGNRRVAALKTLMKGHQDGTSPLPEYIVKSITQLEVLVYDGDDPNIAWILQGLRHMTGIKEWQPLQQAEFLAKVEEVLVDQVVGFEAQLHLEPEHAFGDYDPNLVFFEERSIFPEIVEQGMQFDGMPEGAATEGMPADAVYTVTEVYPTHVVLDGNHPLAGIALRLDLKVIDVREATQEEIEAGSVGQPVFSVMNTAPSGPHLH